MDKNKVLKNKIKELNIECEIETKYVRENFAVYVIAEDCQIRMTYLTPNYEKDLSQGTLEPDAILLRIRGDINQGSLTIRQGFDPEKQKNHIYLNVDSTALTRKNIEEYVDNIRNTEKVMQIVEYMYDLYFPGTLLKK